MEVWPLEIRIIKANDLKDVNLITKMDAYAVVSISGDQLNNRKHKTNVDKDGGTAPTWNFPINFTVDDAAVQDNRLTLKIKLLSNRSLGDKEIGVVYVQIKELFDNSVHREGGADDGENAAGNEEKFVSYSVRLSNGKAKGTLDLAYKFGGKYKVESPPLPPPQTAEPYGMKGMEAPPVMAYPSTFPASSSSYPPPADAYPPPPAGYPYAPPPRAYPPSHSGGYPPPPPGYGYPPPGYGYGGGYQPPPPGYGYQPMQPPQKPKKNGYSGVGMGLGAGLLGGLLIGDMISDF